MKFFNKLLFLVFVLHTASAMSLSSIYVGAIGGALLTKDLATNSADLNSNLPDGVDIDYKPGYKIGIFSGVDLSAFRIEAELSRLKSEAKEIVVQNNSIPLTGSTTNHILMGNAIAYLPSVISPYIGGGLGYVHINNKINVSSKSNVFGYQLIAGMSFNISMFTMFIDYRYIGTSRADALNKSYSNNTANAGFFIAIA